MDRSCASEPDHSTAMRTAGSAAFELLLSAAAGERSQSGSAPPARSVVCEAPLFRQPQNGCRAGSEPQAHPAPDAYPRHRSPLSQTKFQSPDAGASSLSVPAAGVEILRPNQVWSTDITCLPMRGGFLYVVAVMDWFGRFVLSWKLSNTMESSFCLAALDAAFRFGQPEIWNSDQGSQFTSAEFCLRFRSVAS